MKTYTVTVNDVEYSFEYDDSVTPSNYLNVNDFITARPTMSVFSDEQIKEAINISYSLLDSKTNFLISSVIDYNYVRKYKVTNETTTDNIAAADWPTDATDYPKVSTTTNDDGSGYVYTVEVLTEAESPTDELKGTKTTYTYTLTFTGAWLHEGETGDKLYRTDDELHCIHEALVMQTQYTINLANDYTGGGGSLSTGGIATSWQRPSNMQKVSDGVYDWLQRARVYQLNNALVGGSGFYTGEVKKPVYITQEEADARYLKLYQSTANAGTVLTVNESKVIETADPSNISINITNADKIKDVDGSYKLITEISDLAFYGDDGSNAITINKAKELYQALQWWSALYSYTNGYIIKIFDTDTLTVSTWRSNQPDNLNHNPLTDNKDNYWWTLIRDDESDETVALMSVNNTLAERITTLDEKVDTAKTNLWASVTTNQNNITANTTQINALEQRLDTTEGNLSTLEQTVADNQAQSVLLTGDQTIAGNKTFTGETRFNAVTNFNGQKIYNVGTPDGTLQVANKKYVDDQVNNLKTTLEIKKQNVVVVNSTQGNLSNDSSGLYFTDMEYQISPSSDSEIIVVLWLQDPDYNDGTKHIPITQWVGSDNRICMRILGANKQEIQALADKDDNDNNTVNLYYLLGTNS